MPMFNYVHAYEQNYDHSAIKQGTSLLLRYSAPIKVSEKQKQKAELSKNLYAPNFICYVVHIGSHRNK